MNNIKREWPWLQQGIISVIRPDNLWIGFGSICLRLDGIGVTATFRNPSTLRINRNECGIYIGGKMSWSGLPYGVLWALRPEIADKVFDWVVTESTWLGWSGEKKVQQWERRLTNEQIAFGVFRRLHTYAEEVKIMAWL